MITNKEWKQELEMAKEEFGLEETQLVELGKGKAIGVVSTPVIRMKFHSD